MVEDETTTEATEAEEATSAEQDDAAEAEPAPDISKASATVERVGSGKPSNADVFECSEGDFHSRDADEVAVHIAGNHGATKAKAAAKPKVARKR